MTSKCHKEVRDPVRIPIAPVTVAVLVDVVCKLRRQYDSRSCSYDE